MIGFVLPTYGKFTYAHRAAASFFETTPGGSVILVDDASPQWARQNWDVWKAGMPEDRLHVVRFEENAGLTRGWNVGLEIGIQQRLKYLIAGNSDVIFTPGWHEPMTYALDGGEWHLVGPVTNTPGWTNSQRQHIKHFVAKYKLSDDKDELAAQARELAQTQPMGRIIEMKINGFFQMAKAETWDAGRFDRWHVYDPANRMTKNEDELQARWLKKGWKIGIVPRSFVFHYRAVTRGDAHKHGDWYRMGQKES